MRRIFLAALIAPILLSGCVSTALGVTGAVVGAGVHATGAVVGAGVKATGAVVGAVTPGGDGDKRHRDH